MEKIELKKTEIDNLNIRLQMVKDCEVRSQMAKESLQRYFEGVLKTYGKEDGEWSWQGDFITKKVDDLKVVNLKD